MPWVGFESEQSREGLGRIRYGSWKVQSCRVCCVRPLISSVMDEMPWCQIPVIVGTM